jgi:hypothetical protein
MNRQPYSRERRRHPRINERVPFTIRSEDFDSVTETLNLSCLGAYCLLNKCLPLMMSLKITLALPRGGQAKAIDYAECQGVVVRVEEAESHRQGGREYNTAIYFNEIEESQKRKIARLIESRQGKPINNHASS